MDVEGKALSGDVVRWGVCGTGNIATDFCNAMRLVPDAELVAVGSRSKEGAERFGRLMGVPPSGWFATYESLAQSHLVDVVYIATPNATHRDLVQCLADAGKAILCEKPFAVNGMEARLAADACRKAAVYCREAMWTRDFPATKRVLDTIRSGKLGTVTTVTASFGFSYDEEDWDGALGLPGMGGGCLLDIGCYPLHFASMVAREVLHDDAPAPTSISATGSLRDSGVDDEVTAVVCYDGGLRCELTASCKRDLDNEACVVGTKGAIRVHSPFWAPEGVSERLDAGEEERECELEPIPERAADATGDENFVNTRGMCFQITAIHAALRRGLAEAPELSLAESVRLAETMDEIRRHIGVTFPQDRKAEE